MAATSTMLPLGTPIPDFRLPDAHGDDHSPADRADAAALLTAFVCNHCPYVIHIAPAFGQLTQRWADQGVATLAITSNDLSTHPEDGPEFMGTFAAAHDWRFPYLLDEEQHVARAFRAACTPDLFLFDADRRLAYRGQLDASRPGNKLPVTGTDLEAAIQDVLAGRPVSDDQAPSMGCSIKWKPGNEPAWHTR